MSSASMLHGNAARLRQAASNLLNDLPRITEPVQSQELFERCLETYLAEILQTAAEVCRSADSADHLVDEAETQWQSLLEQLASGRAEFDVERTLDELLTIADLLDSVHQRSAAIIASVEASVARIEAARNRLNCDESDDAAAQIRECERILASRPRFGERLSSLRAELEMFPRFDPRRADEARAYFEAGGKGVPLRAIVDGLRD